MKKVFYRSSCNRSFTKLFSLLAFAALSFSFTDEAAGWPGTSFGGGGFFGSEVHLSIILGDTLENKVSPSARLNGGFYDVTIDPFTQGNTVSCEYAKTTVFTPAACVLQITCFGFQESTSCQGNNPPTITSLMTCQENASSTAAPGCEGSIFVNPTSESNPSILPSTVEIKVGGNANLANCDTAYPRVTGANPLPAGVIGSITQEFAKNSKCTGSATKVTANIRAKSSEVDPAQVSTSNAGLLIQQNEAVNAACSQFPVQTTCTDSGGIWIAADGADLAALGLSVQQIVNNPQTLRCGTDGPAPSQCRRRDSFPEGNNKDGVLDAECRCPTCNVATGEFLSNDDAYTLTQTAGAPKWTAVCPVGSPGN